VDKQTDIHTHHNTSHPSEGQGNNSSPNSLINSCFTGQPGLDDSFSTCSFGDKWEKLFYRLDVLPIDHLMACKH